MVFIFDDDTYVAYDSLVMMMMMVMMVMMMMMIGDW